MSRVLVGVVFALLLPNYSFAHSGDSFTTTFGTPTIDGIQSTGEWDTAVQIPVFTLAPGTVYIMHDFTNLYFALRVTDNTLGNDDRFEIRFDNAHNGTIDDGDDELRLGGLSLFRDAHFEASIPTFGIHDAQQDGSGAAGHAGADNFFEISHPLNSGEVDDIAIAEGDSISFCLRYFLDGTSYASGTGFPKHSFWLETSN